MKKRIIRITRTAVLLALLPVELTSTVVGRYQKEADHTIPLDSKYSDVGGTPD